jgi:hypothetical protein
VFLAGRTLETLEEVATATIVNVSCGALVD